MSTEVEKIIDDLLGSGIVQKTEREVIIPVDEGVETIQHLTEGDIQVRVMSQKRIKDVEISIKKPTLKQLSEGWILTTTGDIKLVSTSDYTEIDLQKMFANGRWFLYYKDAIKKQQEERVLGNIKVVREMLNDGWEEDYYNGYVISYDEDLRYFSIDSTRSVNDFNKLGVYKDYAFAEVIVELFKEEIESYLV